MTPKLPDQNEDAHIDSPELPPMYGKFSPMLLANIGMRRNACPEAFFKVVDSLEPTSRRVLSQTSTAMYNAINANVIQWDSRQGKFCRLDYYNDSNGAKCNYRPIPSTELLMKEQPSWKVIVHGDQIGWVGSDEEARSAEKVCMRKTARMLVRLCGLVNTGVIISELVFVEWDMLSPIMINNTNLRPFANLRRVQFIECREFTMIQVAEYLTSFSGRSRNFEVVYVPHRSNLAIMNNVNPYAAMLSGLYRWRDTQPKHFIRNLLIDGRFRTLIQNWTRSSGDDWYAFMNRSGDTSKEDRMLLDRFNGKPLVTGSNLERLQECRTCLLEMPGLAFAKSRPASGERECYGCKHDDLLF